MLGQRCSLDHGAFPKKYFETCAMGRGGRICPDVDRYFPQRPPYRDRCIPWSAQVVGDGCLDDPITPVHTDRSQRCWPHESRPFEMPYENRERMATFYGSAFGWQTQMLGEDMGQYVIATTTETDEKGPKTPGAINGGCFQKRSDRPYE
jgi:hypothetical protein